MSYLFSTVVLLLLVMTPAGAQQCPTVTIDGPSKVELGMPIVFEARIQNSSSTVQVTYQWKVSAGTITSAADTNKMTLDSTGLEGQIIEVALEIAGPEKSCRTTIPHQVVVEIPRRCRLEDDYGDIRFEDEKARLDNIAIQIQNSPNARGLFTAFAGDVTYPGEARFRLNRAKNYLVKTRGIDPKRIITVDAGYSSDFTMKFHIIPNGTEIPDFSGIAGIPKSSVRFTKRRPGNSRYRRK